MAERKLGHKFREDGVEWLVVVEFVMIVERILEVSIALHFLVHLSEDVGLVWFDELQQLAELYFCLLYTSPSPRDQRGSRMPSSA